MKRILKIIFPIFIIVMMLCTTLVRADFNVTVGQIKFFEVPISNWTVASGGNSGGGTGFKLQGNSYSVGSSIKIEVTAESASSVNYDLNVTSKVHSFVSSSFGLTFFFAFSIMLPLHLELIIGGTWNQTDVDIGPPLWGDIFMDPIFSENFWQFANNQTYVDEITSDDDNSDITFDKIEGVFTNSTNIATFDWALDFHMINSTINTDYSGIYRWKFAYDQTTCWVKGWRVMMDYGGTIEGSPIDVLWNQVVYETGYTLPDFVIPTTNTTTTTTITPTTVISPGFEWFLFLPSIGLLALPIIYKKRK